VVISKKQAIENYNRAVELKLQIAIKLIDERLKDHIAGDMVSLCFINLGLGPDLSSSLRQGVLKAIIDAYTDQGWQVEISDSLNSSFISFK